MKKIKIAIIGLRHLHPRSYMTHFKMIEDVDVIAVAEKNESIRNQFVNDFDVLGYENWIELFEKEKIDLAAIFLPHIQCPDAALEAIDRGINLMIEKPMTVDSASAQKIVDQARKRNLMVTTPYVWRYHPVVKEIKQIIETGMLGQVIGCTGRCAAGRLQRYIDGNAEWMLDAAQSGGGPMYNLGVHWIDLFTWLLGDSVKNAFGTNVKVNQNYNIEDNSSAILKYKNGTVLNLDISYTVPEAYPHGRDLFIGIRGTRGVISWAPAYEGEKDELFICSDHDSVKGAPIQRRMYELTPVAGYSGIMGLHYLQDVVQAIRNGKSAPISGEEGVAVLKIVEAIYKSVEKKSIINIEDV